MGSLPALSVLKGPHRPLAPDHDAAPLHRIFETTVAALDKLTAANSTHTLAANNNQILTAHSIAIDECAAQQTALIAPSATATFDELNRAANRLARAILASLPGDAPPANADGDVLVAVCIRPSLELVTALLAIWKVGAAYLPLDPAFPATRITHILQESQPAMTIVDDFDIGHQFKATTYAALQAKAMDAEDSNLPEDLTLTKDVPRKDLLAAVLYTSGSTGVPKGVRIPHSAALNRLKWQWRTFPYSPSEKVCVFKTALTFVDSVCELWGPLLNARSVLVLPKEDTKNPERLTALLEKHEVERLILVPTLLQSILLFASIGPPRRCLPNLRLWVCSGEALSLSLANSFFDRFPPDSHTLCNFYGSTELMGDVTFHVIHGPDDLRGEDKVPIGKPLDNCTVYVLDKDLRPVSANQVGELYVSGWNLAAGYVRGRDAERFLDNPLAVDPGHMKLYRTGDFARIAKGTVYYEGRTDSQIKVRGHRVDLSEIEAAVGRVAEVEEHLVLTYRPGDADQAVLAFVTANAPIAPKAIEERLSAALPPYMVPQVVLVDHFPLLVNGKVDRQHFLRQYREQRSAGEGGAEGGAEGPGGAPAADYSGVPAGKMRAAKALFETTSAVLGRALRGPVRADSNFYHLGGNSLNSVYTVTKLRDMGFVISISDFISSATLLEAVNKMQEECTGAAAEEQTALREKYRAELLSEAQKKEVYDIITVSFFEKADLESHLEPPVPMSDYVELMDALWPHLLQKNLSFVAVDAEGGVKGAALNFDAHDEPDVPIRPDNRLNVVFQFLEFLEGPIREEKLPKGKGKVLHSFMMGTKTSLSGGEAVEVFCFMEEEVLGLAKRRGFEGVFTSNTNELTQQLGSDVNNYESLLNYQVNKYTAPDGSRPFEKAPDSQRTIVSWKPI